MIVKTLPASEAGGSVFIASDLIQYTHPLLPVMPVVVVVIIVMSAASPETNVQAGDGEMRRMRTVKPLRYMPVKHDQRRCAVSVPI